MSCKNPPICHQRNYSQVGARKKWRTREETCSLTFEENDSDGNYNFYSGNFRCGGSKIIWIQFKKKNKPGETIKKVFRYFPITNPNMYYFHNYFYLDYYGKTTLIYYV